MWASSALAALDRDGDGEIHISEFIHWLVDKPAEIDRDRDEDRETEIGRDRDGDRDTETERGATGGNELDLDLPDLSEEEGNTDGPSGAAEEALPPQQAETEAAAEAAAVAAAEAEAERQRHALAARISTPATRTGGATPPRSPDDQRAAFSASVQAKLAQRPPASAAASAVPFDLSLYTPRGSAGHSFRPSPGSAQELSPLPLSYPYTLRSACLASRPDDPSALGWGLRPQPFCGRQWRPIR